MNAWNSTAPTLIDEANQAVRKLIDDLDINVLLDHNDYKNFQRGKYQSCRDMNLILGSK